MKTLVKEVLEARRSYAIGIARTRWDLEAVRLNPKIIDGIELRLDELYAADLVLEADHLLSLGKPIILTVRDSEEQNVVARETRPPLSLEARIVLFRYYLHLTTFIDIEAANVRKYAALIEEALSLGIGIIVSKHVFGRMFSAAELVSAVGALESINAHILKMVAEPESATDWRPSATDAVKLCASKNIPLALMASSKAMCRASRIEAVLNKMPLVYGPITQRIASFYPSVMELRGYIHPPTDVTSAVEEESSVAL